MCLLEIVTQTKAMGQLESFIPPGCFLAQAPWQVEQVS